MTTLRFDQLTVDRINVRTTLDPEAIRGLASSIKAQGIITPLTVRKNGDGDTYAVVAGKRRYLALQSLVKEGFLPKHEAVPVHVLELDDTAAQTASLTENTVREAMNAADEALAFAALVKKGKTITEIAAAFGVPERRVNRRLAIADVSPKVLETLRVGKISPEVAAAFTASADHALQNKTLKALLSHDFRVNPEYVRRQLRETTVNASSKLGLFVGRQAYEAAGGKVTSDLFDDAVVFDDGKLVNKLALEKAKTFTADMKAAGWSWCKSREEVGSHFWNLDRIKSEPFYSAEQKLRVADLTKLLKELDDDESERFYQAKHELDAITYAARIAGFTDEQKAASGVVLDLQNFEISYGLAERKAEKGQRAKADTKAKGDKAALPNTLLEDFAKCMAGGVQMVLARDPDLAEAVLLAQLAGKAADDAHGLSGPLSLTGDIFRVTVERDASKRDPAFAGNYALLDSLAPLIKGMPHKFVERVQWVQKKKPADRRKLLAHVTAAFVGSTRGGTWQAHHDHEVAGQLVKLAAPDMREWWKPTKHNMLSRLNRGQLLAVMRECKVPAVDNWKNAKKAELVVAAAEAAEKAGWLPKELRVK